MSEGILSAGAVLWRPAADGIEVLLVHRPKYDDWSLPKGKREPGEHVLLTAAREVYEETSVRPVLGPRLRTVEYLVHDRPKQVDYWAALCTHDEAAASHEIDAVCWLPLPQVLERLSYAHDADVIASLRPRATVPLILVRHASAGHKSDWAGEDLLRPLDAEGVAGGAAAGRPAGLFRSSRPGVQFARPAVHPERTPVRRGVRGARRGDGRSGRARPCHRVIFGPNGPG